MQNTNPNFQQNKNSSTKIVFILSGVLVALIVVLFFVFFNKTSNQVTPVEEVKTDVNNKLETSGSNSTSSDVQLKQRELDLKEQELRLKEKELDQQKRNENSSRTTTQTQRSSTPGRFPEGSERYLSGSDLQYMTKGELELMRNEIFARHGYIFTKNEKMIQYFNSQSWYNPTSYDVNNLLSKIEKENVALIKIYEK